jgi:hypothetical protein
VLDARPRRVHSRGVLDRYVLAGAPPPILRVTGRASADGT